MNRLELALQSTTPERLRQLNESGFQYSPATVRKHAWVLNLYHTFVGGPEDSLFPLHAQTIASFIRFLAFDAHYAVGSIEDVIVPALKRMHISSTATPLDDRTRRFILEALREIKRLKTPTPDNAKEPAIVTDIERIISVTPDELPSKVAEACLFLLSVSTGARACTCEAIKLGDILSCYSNPERGSLLIQLRYVVTKGDPLWNHVVTIEGSPVVASNVDVVYWLQKHLVTRFSLDLFSYDTWNLSAEMQETKLYKWSKDSMRELFKSRAILAGFPPGLFGFHSLRSGFMCSAIVRANCDPSAMKGVLENAAYVAGWIPHRRAQLGYIKSCAKKSIVSNRLVLPGSDTLGAQPIDPLLCSSEKFHAITLSEPSWSDNVHYLPFLKKLNELFHKDGWTEDANELLRKKCLRHALNYYVKMDPVLEEEARLIYCEKPQWSTPSRRCAAEEGVRCSVGRQKIIAILKDDPSQLEHLVDTMFRSVDHILERDELKRNVRSVPNVDTSSTRELDSKGNRKRKMWEPEEDAILVRKYAAVGPKWIRISQLLVDRTNSDCKDRFRNLETKYKSRIELLAAFPI